MEKEKRMEKYKLSRQKYLNDEEQTHLNRVLKMFETREPRNTTLIWLGIHSGARASELLNITESDLDHHSKSVFIKGIKKSDDRDIPLPQWLFKKLTALPPDKDSRIFPIGYQRFYKIWCEYRPAKKKLHSLRHTFAINLYRKCKDLRILQVALGHKNWNNTMIYADYQYRTDELRKAMLG